MRTLIAGRCEKRIVEQDGQSIQMRPQESKKRRKRYVHNRFDARHKKSRKAIKTLDIWP